MKKSLLLNFALIFSFVALASCKSKLEVTTINITKADGSVISLKAEIADKPDTRNYGYMNRKNIPDGTGMIFIFERDQILSFWMKNTPHPLSIAYIDTKGTIKDILDMTPFSLSPVKSTHSVRYALEVPQGWYEKNNITVGCTVDISQFK